MSILEVALGFVLHVNVLNAGQCMLVHIYLCIFTEKKLKTVKKKISNNLQEYICFFFRKKNLIKHSFLRAIVFLYVYSYFVFFLAIKKKYLTTKNAQN